MSHENIDKDATLSFVLKLVRVRVLRNHSSGIPLDKAPRLVGYISGHYHDTKTAKIKSIDTEEKVLYEGSDFILPYKSNSGLHLQAISFHYFQIDGSLSVEIGESIFNLKDCTTEKLSSDPVEVQLDIVMNGAEQRVGRCLVALHVEDFFESDNNNVKKTKTNKISSSGKEKPSIPDYHPVSPDFRFRRLSRSVNWDRIRNIPIERVLHNGDHRSIIACLEDVCYGDTSQEQVDPLMHKALYALQYGAQYLVRTRSTLREKQELISSALEAFDEEEVLLDLKIAKLKAREKALGRESKDLDRVTLQYSTTLQSLNPRMLDNLYSVYKDKVGDDRKKKKKKKEATNEKASHNRPSNSNSNSNTTYKDSDSDSVVEIPKKAVDEVRARAVISKYSKDATKRLQPREVQDRSDEESSPPIVAHTYTWNNNSAKRPDRDEISTLARVKANSEPTNTVAPSSSSTTTTTRRGESPIMKRVAGGVDLPPAEQNVQVKKIGGKYRLTDTAKPTNASASTIEVEVPGSNLKDEDAFPKRRPISSSRSSYLSAGVDSDSDNSQNEKGDSHRFSRDTIPKSLKSSTWVSAAAPSSSITSALSNTVMSEDSLAARASNNHNSSDSQQHLLLRTTTSDSAQVGRFDALGRMDSYTPKSMLKTFPVEKRQQSSWSSEEDSDRRSSVNLPGAVDESLLEINTDMHYEFSEGSSRIMGNFSQLSINEDDITTNNNNNAPVHTSSSSKGLPTSTRNSTSWKEKAKRSSFDYTFKEEDELEEEEQGTYSKGGSSYNKPDHRLITVDEDDSLEISMIDMSKSDKKSKVDPKADTGRSTGSALHTDTYKEDEDDEDDDSIDHTDSLARPDSARRTVTDAQHGRAHHFTASSSGSDSNLTSAFGRVGRSEVDDDAVLLGTAKMATFNFVDTMDTGKGASSLASTILSPLGELALNNRFDADGPDQLSYDSVLSPMVHKDEKDADAKYPPGTDHPIQWLPGRASVEMIEMARSIDVQVSSLRMDRDTDMSVVFVDVHFLDIISDISHGVSLSSYVSTHPVGFCAHIVVGKESFPTLAQSVLAAGDKLSISVNLMTHVDGSGSSDHGGDDGGGMVTVGQADLPLAVMLEDSCNILRQEVDIVRIDTGGVIGTAVVDVRGYRLLQKLCKRVS